MTDIEVRKIRLTYKAKLRRWQNLRKFLCSDAAPLSILISLQPSGEKNGSGRNEERRGESTSSRCNQTIMWTLRRRGDVSRRAFSDMIPIKMCCVLLGLYSRKNNRYDWTEQLSFFIPPFLVLAQVCSCQQGLHSWLQHGFNLY